MFFAVTVDYFVGFGLPILVVGWRKWVTFRFCF